MLEMGQSEDCGFSMGCYCANICQLKICAILITRVSSPPDVPYSEYNNEGDSNGYPHNGWSHYTGNGEVAVWSDKVHGAAF